jgi:hypothetical protein
MPIAEKEPATLKVRLKKYRHGKPCFGLVVPILPVALSVPPFSQKLHIFVNRTFPCALVLPRQFLISSLSFSRCLSDARGSLWLFTEQHILLR